MNVRRPWMRHMERPFASSTRGRSLGRWLWQSVVVATVVVSLTAASDQRTAIAKTTRTLQRFTLCAVTPIPITWFARLHTALATRLTTNQGISAVRVVQESPRCLRITLIAHGPRRAAVIAAGKIGNVLFADTGRQNLQSGTRVHLVCSTPGCAPGMKVGLPHPSGQPPVLRVVFSQQDVNPSDLGVSASTPFRGAGRIYLLFLGLKQRSLPRWCAFTQRHVGQFVAVVLDGVVLIDPRIQAPLCGNPGVAIQLADYRQENWVEGYLRTGPLPLRLSLLPRGAASG